MMRINPLPNPDMRPGMQRPTMGMQKLAQRPPPGCLRSAELSRC